MARRQLDIRITLPPGMVKIRSSGRLPSAAPASLMAMNRGTETVRVARAVARELIQLSGLRPRPELRELAERLGVLP